MAMNFKPIYSVGSGGTPSANPYKTAATQTFKVGDMVSLTTAGLVTDASDTTTGLLGVAASAATGSAEGDEVLVYDDPGLVYLAASDTASECLQTLVGAQVDLNEDQDDGVDTNGSSAVVLTVVDLWSNRSDSASIPSGQTISDQILVTIINAKHIFGDFVAP